MSDEALPACPILMQLHGQHRNMASKMQRAVSELDSMIICGHAGRLCSTECLLSVVRLCHAASPDRNIAVNSEVTQEHLEATQDKPLGLMVLLQTHCLGTAARSFL